MRALDLAPFAVVAALLPATAALADVIHLKPVGKVDGEIVRETDDAYVVRLSTGGTTTIPKRHVVGIERTAAAGGALAVRATPGSASALPAPSAAPATAPVRTSAVVEHPDDGWLPQAARLHRGPRPKTPPPPDGFVEAARKVLAAADAVAVEAWAREAEETAPAGAQAHLADVLATFRGRDAIGKSLLRGWVARAGEAAEARLVGLVEAARIWNVRAWAHDVLRGRATWRGSLALVWKLMDVPHPPSEQAAGAVLEALASRSAPDDEGSLLETIETRLEKATAEPSRAIYFRTLMHLGERGSVGARLVLRDLDRKARMGAEGASVTVYLLRALEVREAHDLITRAIADVAPETRTLRIIAVRTLSDCGGSYDDFPLLLRTLEAPGATEDRALTLSVLSAAATISSRRFGSVGELRSWWANVQARIDGEVPGLIERSKGEGPAAVEAVRRLADVRTAAVGRALRSAAEALDPKVRVAAVRAIAERRDRGSLPAALQALRRAPDATDRRSIVHALAPFAPGAPVPWDDPEAALAFFRARFPRDLAE